MLLVGPENREKPLPKPVIDKINNKSLGKYQIF